MTAEQIWEYDKRKINLALEYGYKILIIWEDDFHKDPEKIINDCIKFIYD